jgi:glycosyltransferase involved in cell wall biosynthesis
MSTLLFHPSVAPFVQQAARALHEGGALHSFHTTLRHAPDEPWQRLAARGARLVGYDFETQLRRRAVTGLPAGLVHARPAGELLRLLAARLDSSRRLGDFVWEKTELAFDRHVARRLAASDADSVYGFEHSSLATFQTARATGRRIFYDVPAPEPGFVQSMLEREFAAHPVLDSKFQRHVRPREARRAARRHAEWDLADVVLAASRFTRDTFARAGRDTSKVVIVPYGAPPPAPAAPARAGGSSPPNAPLSLIWAGTFGARKGAHYLLDAWRRGQLGRHARLNIYGAVTLPDELLHPLPQGVELHGSIPRAALMDRYQQSDLLVFPSLCDGFGMVATEAWSRGVPVLTTDCAGCSDLLRPGVNGLIVPAGDATALLASLHWCLEHRAELRAMREPSLATAARWQWSDYRAALRAALLPAPPGDSVA